MLPLQDTIRARSFPAINWLLILINGGVFVVFELGLPTRELQALVLRYGVVPARLVALETDALVSLFTSMFLHGGWLHLISNMWALYIFGDNVEDRMGSGRYLLFYLICGIAAAFSQALVNPASQTPMIGASGALSGVLAAYLILFPGSRVITLIPFFFLPWFVEIPAVVYLVVWFLSQFLSGVLSLGVTATMGGVAYWAHIGGFLAGLVLLPFFSRRPRAQYRWYPDEYRPW